MDKALVVIDMQNDFITGALANQEGQKIVGKIADYIRNFDGDIIATRDTHDGNYLNTQEGQNLPIPHCIHKTKGWEIVPEVQKALDEKQGVTYIDKPTFGSIALGDRIARKLYKSIELIGVCTDICVISNALLIKACAIETPVTVIEDLCAGVTTESHKTAIQAMKNCQIQIKEEEKEIDYDR